MANTSKVKNTELAIHYVLPVLHISQFTLPNQTLVAAGFVTNRGFLGLLFGAKEDQLSVSPQTVLTRAYEYTNSYTKNFVKRFQIALNRHLVFRFADTPGMWSWFPEFLLFTWKEQFPPSTGVSNSSLKLGKTLGLGFGSYRISVSVTRWAT